MTASLPVPNDIDPEEPESHEDASVVALSTSPAPSDTDAPRETPTGAAGTPARKAPRKKSATTTPSKSDAASRPKPRSKTPAPEPETRLSDLQTAERAAADIVIPPRPPLPEPPAATPEVEPEPEPPVVEPEPEPPVVEPAPIRELEPEPAPDLIVAAAPALEGDALSLRGVSKRFGDAIAVDGIDLTVPAGIFYGLVGPNGAGKTTTLSMIAGLLEPDRGSIRVGQVDAASDPVAAKRLMGVLPDRLRTFDRLTGRQLLYYYGVLRGLAPAVVESRTADLARAFDLGDALGRVVSDYSAGMVKKIMLAGALIHSPRVLVLDEPFEAVDPVSSAIILDILSTYVAHGGTVILSSHGMELVERVCSRVAVIVAGQVLAEGTVDEVRGELSLEQRFIELAGGLSDVEGLEWLHTFSD